MVYESTVVVWIGMFLKLHSVLATLAVQVAQVDLSREVSLCCQEVQESLEPLQPL